MYQKLIDFDRSDGLILVAKLNLALADPGADPAQAAQAVRGLLDRAVAQEPERREAILLDTFQGVFANCAGADATKQKRLEGVFATLFSGPGFYPLPLLWEVYCRFERYRADFRAVAELDALYELSNRAGYQSVLAYLIRREALNMLLRSDAFAARVDLVKTLVSDLECAPAAVKAEGTLLGGDLFFYAPAEARV